jgi:hypothetical protein
MNMKERKKGPIRRGGARGRAPAKREGERTPVKKRDERGDQNWTKKFEDGDFDDYFDVDLDEEAAAAEPPAGADEEEAR